MHPLLTIEHLTKAFPGQLALDDVGLEVLAGETHALVGQNGSGKSTLIKILAGYHQPTGDEATATITDGGGEGEGARPFTLGDSGEADRAGIRFVHQDLGLVDSLDAVENLALGAAGYATRLGRIHWRRSRRQAEEALASIGFDDFSVKVPVGSLAPSQKTAVAVARALQGWEDGATLLVLDEPTASLPGADVGRLFDAIRRLRQRGVAILYVSHHLDEVFEIADRVTVLRDGRNVTTEPVAGLDHDRLIQLMIGHRIERGRTAGADARSAGDVRLAVRGLRGGGLEQLDLDVHGGEVVGVAGITGSGRESLVPLVGGQVPSDGGTVEIDGTRIPPYAPAAAMAAGMSFLAADRGRHGIVPTMSVSANTTLGGLRRHLRFLRIAHRREAAEVEGWIDKLGIKTAGRSAAIATLSGGNQQKVLFARGLRRSPTVLVLDEPTRGIDVGAKEEIHGLVDKAAAEGTAVVVVSTDTDELVRLAHRVVVLRGGRVAAELVGARISSETIERAQLADPAPVPAGAPDTNGSRENREEVPA